jgi:anti-anti-sigma factor
MRESGEITILDLCGRSTLCDGETELLAKRLEELVANGARYLLLNMSDLTQVDSSGVSAIVKTYVKLRGQGGDLRLLRPRGHARSVLGVLHLLELIPSFEEEEQALRSFRQPVKSAKP